MAGKETRTVNNRIIVLFMGMVLIWLVKITKKPCKGKAILEEAFGFTGERNN